MGSDLLQKGRRELAQGRRSLEYLDGCGELTYEKLLKAYRLWGADIPESELRELWGEAHHILPTHGEPGGKEALRFILRKNIVKSTAMVEKIVKKLEESEKKWWQFWK